ncbi:O-Glycosyl hydrolase [Chitinophaga sp. CF118]|uniref:glycoside hydrolase family 30 protein n=1 Tax=Chitinophaga sp. CF118 TaxID=1884367 RepID=UPI0008ECC061|nr:glycoside hydrolase family 30 protein [Chitinophaga sp. CF118]SFD59260.1 O-Glycosyl hydrolase [Chitinophaga sp. CF118]
MRKKISNLTTMRKIIVPLLLFCSITATGQTIVHIDTDTTYQTIDNFGASDAWSCQFVGNWPEQKKNAIADWLFSTDTTATGQPMGIGLSMWRYNIGAGTAEQGDSSAIRDEWRRTYNWQSQSGQLWFLQAAKQRKVKQFLAFLNSPPVNLTINGKGFANKGNCNISPEKYDALANYTADVITGIHKKTGILFDYISPVNEPQWEWSDGGQEGCPYNNEQISGVTKSISETFIERKLSTKIIIGEAGKLDYLYAKADKPAKGEQITAFFNNGSPDYLDNLPNIRHTISGHSYFTTSPAPAAIRIRNDLSKNIAAVKNLTFWQSEYCILGDNAGEINGEKRDYGMDAALYLARVIYYDLAVANAAAWQYWLAVSPYDYKDGLIYIDKNTKDGQYRDSKMMWALGNYSRFVRPGAKRIKTTVSDNDTLLVSTYQNTDRTITIVAVNSSKDVMNISLDYKKGKIKKLRSYITSDTGNLEPIAVDNNINIPARSVVTITGNIK